MDKDELIKDYIDAWNQLDVGRILELMHPGAAYFDAFWAETCVGRDLARYFQDAMDEEPYWYQQIDEPMDTGNGVVYRYSAHDRSGSITDEPVLYGAEILNFRDEKILTVTDIYCSPYLSDLEEVARLAANRHGLPSHANAGLGALKTARIKANLSASIHQEKVFLDPDITMSQLAQKIGCTLDQLVIVVETQFGSDIGQFLDAQRVEFARAMLEANPNSTDILQRVATSSGFKNVREFSSRFTDIVGIAPADFCRQMMRAGIFPDNSNIH